MEEENQVPKEFNNLVEDRKAMINELKQMEKEFNEDKTDLDDVTTALILIRIQAKANYITYIAHMLDNPEKSQVLMDNARAKAVKKLLKDDETGSFPSD